jgi:gas vesicle protein
MNDTKENNTPMIFMRGLILGAVLTALFSPRSGEDLRKNIKGKIDDMKEKAKEKSDQAKEKADELKDKSKDVANEAADNANQNIGQRGSRSQTTR